MLVYRYREAKSFNIDALIAENINGSSFRTFDDFTELNFDFTNKTAASFKISPDEKGKIIDILKNNIKDKYYMACFTFNDPFLTKNMWKQYAGNGNGYCLAYDTDDLERQIRKQRLGEVSMRIVTYSSKPFPIDDLIEHILSEKGIRRELENNRIDEAVSKDSERIGRIITNMFVHKYSSCFLEREYRMILQDIDNANKIRNDKMLHVRPKFIVMTKGICDFMKVIIHDYAKRNNVPCVLINNPCIRLEEETYVEE